MRNDKAAEIIFAAEHPPGPRNLEKRTQEKASVNEKFTPVQWGNNTYTEFTLKSGLF